MSTSFYFGLRLFSYRHYVGAVLHVYNILRSLSGFQQIPLLEECCALFEDILFPGGRPKQKYRASYMRFSGGRLRFNSKKSHHRSGSHEIEIPTQAANSTAGFGLEADSRFPYQKISMLHHIKDRSYSIDRAYCQWTSAQKGSSMDKKHSTCPHHVPDDDGYPFNPHHGHLDQLHDAVSGEVHGRFPVARINFFKVYLACIRIITVISKSTHDSDDRGTHCLCFLDMMLTAADRYKENEHRAQPFGYKDLVKVCQESMITVLADEPLDNFLWKGI